MATANFEDVVPKASHHATPTCVAPSADDDLIRGGSALVGGPVGTHARLGSGWWSPLRVLVALTAVGFLVGEWQRLPCMINGWGDGRYLAMCYSDIPPLYALRGFADGVFPYIDPATPTDQVLEYPVLTGLFIALAAWLTPAAANNATLWFFNVNSVMLFACLVVAVLATALTVRRRPWDAAMVALAPGVILCATINWDLLAVCLLALALLAWSRSRPGLAGVLIGLAAAAKFYPILILWPLLWLCIRAWRISAFARCAVGALAAWLVVNVPFMLINFDGWSRFYSFSSDRGEDFGSVWFVLTNAGRGVAASGLNRWASVAFAVLAIAVAALILLARRRPRVAQVAFLTVAAFLLTNKVYSPQYVIWLIPLAALARPRWRDFLIWQACELAYFAGIWLYLAQMDGDKGIPVGWYSAAIMVHLVGTAWLAGMIVRDVLRPQCDPVRSDGEPADGDDPGGGVLDRSPDVVSGGSGAGHPHSTRSSGRHG